MASASPAVSRGEPVSVLFVCLGNICRSPMAEGVFRKIACFDTPEKHPLIQQIDSCGTGAYHVGDAPDPRTMAVLRHQGLTEYKHQARKVAVPEDFEKFDYILAMDRGNLTDLQDMAQRAKARGLLTEPVRAKLHLYGEFGGRTGPEPIEDPWYDGGSQGFEIAYEQATRMGNGLLKHIEEQARKELHGQSEA